MTKTKHKVGDIVTIREWVDMAEEFQETNHGLMIHNEGTGVTIFFDPIMKRFCGFPLVIRKVEPDGTYKVKGVNKWCFTDQMFTDWKPTSFIDFGPTDELEEEEPTTTASETFTISFNLGNIPPITLDGPKALACFVGLVDAYNTAKERGE